MKSEGAWRTHLPGACTSSPQEPQPARAASLLCQQEIQPAPGPSTHLLGNVSISRHILSPQDCPLELLINRLLAQATLQPTAAPGASPESYLQKEVLCIDHPLKMPIPQDSPSLLSECPQVVGPGRVGSLALFPIPQRLLPEGKARPSSSGPARLLHPPGRWLQPGMHSLRLRCSGKRIQVPRSLLAARCIGFPDTGLLPRCCSLGEGGASCSHTALSPSILQAADRKLTERRRNGAYRYAGLNPPCLS